MKTMFATIRLAVVVPDNIASSEHAAYAADCVNEAIRAETMAFSDNSAIFDYEITGFEQGPEAGAHLGEGEIFEEAQQ